MKGKVSPAIRVAGLVAMLALSVLLLGSKVGQATSAVFTVNSTDDIDDGTCDATHCSLREAINAANAGPGTDTIEFDIPGTGPHTIQPAAALPTITDAVVIDGTTEPDFAGSPMIELDGSNAGDGVDGLHITAGNSTVRGLVINWFDGDGIELQVSGGNVIEGNFIGTDVAGTFFGFNSLRGVFINDTPDNTLGGPTTEARNVISSNFSHGVEISGGNATGNLVQGNFVGVDVTGNAPLSNFGYGVVIDGARSNTIGGPTSEARNVISGNVLGGVHLLGGAATGNHVQGNFIGTDATGNVGMNVGGGFGPGVTIHEAPNNTIGGMVPGAGNVISHNEFEGVLISGTGATGNLVQGNFIGTDVTGTSDLGNFGWGVVIADAPNNTVGGTTAGAGNLISANGWSAITIWGSAATGNRVEGNLIGTDVTGTIGLGEENGVIIFDAPNNTIGGTTPEARNVISGNEGTGIFINGQSATGNRVQGNLIGTDVAGTAALGNGLAVLIRDAPGNTIGGTTAGAGNVISGNDRYDGYGVVIEGNEATGNLVQGNFIGTDISGTRSLPNAGDGVRIIGASSNTIGGTAAGARNVISGNRIGVIIVGGAGNAVQGNFIGTDVTGTARIGNWLGVHIVGPNNTVGGTAPGAGNVISGNDTAGVSIVSGSATGNLVQGNLIGTDVTGTAALGNEWGVLLRTGNNTIGGTAAGAGNVISGNRGLGLNINQRTGRENLVQGNFIGTDVTGTTALGNGGDGVLINTGASDNTIGGTTPQARNVISGNDGVGISISGPPTAGNQVQGNYIGTQVDGRSPLGNSSHGVLNVGPTRDNVIGGRASGAGNTIAFNGGDGVSIHYSFSTGNAILSNSIFSNAGRGIDLGGDGVSPNDAGDGDTGANNLQNFPLLAAAGSGSTAIQGTLNSTSATEFGLEFFSVSTCDPSGYGEGETLLGSAAVTTDSSGNASFAVSFVPVGPPRRFVTATATDPDGNTSEFSPCTAIPVAECVFADGFGRGTELLVTGDAWALTGPGGFEASGTGARRHGDRVVVSGRSGNVVVSGEGMCPSGAGHFRAVELDPPRRKLRLVDLG